MPIQPASDRLAMQIYRNENRGLFLLLSKQLDRDGKVHYSDYNNYGQWDYAPPSTAQRPPITPLPTGQLHICPTSLMPLRSMHQ